MGEDQKIRVVFSDQTYSEETLFILKYLLMETESTTKKIFLFFIKAKTHAQEAKFIEIY